MSCDGNDPIRLYSGSTSFVIVQLMVPVRPRKVERVNFQIKESKMYITYNNNKLLAMVLENMDSQLYQFKELA